MTALVLTGCSRLVPYTPRTDLTRAEAQRVIRMAIESQPHPHTPDGAVEVSSDRMIWGVDVIDNAPFNRTTIRQTAAVYFEQISEVDLYRRKGRHFVYVQLSNRQPKRIWVGDQAEGERLLDALYVMINTAASKYESDAASEERLRKLRRLQDETEALREEQERAQQRRKLEVEPENPKQAE